MHYNLEKEANTQNCILVVFAGSTVVLQLHVVLSAESKNDVQWNAREDFPGLPLQTD